MTTMEASVEECVICNCGCGPQNQHLQCYKICHEQLNIGTTLMDLESQGYLVPECICQLYAEICKACAADYKNAIDYEFYRTCAEACSSCHEKCIAC